MYSLLQYERRIRRDSSSPRNVVLAKANPKQPPKPSSSNGSFILLEAVLSIYKYI